MSCSVAPFNGHATTGDNAFTLWPLSILRTGGVGFRLNGILSITTRGVYKEKLITSHFITLLLVSIHTLSMYIVWSQIIFTDSTRMTLANSSAARTACDPRHQGT